MARTCHIALMLAPICQRLMLSTCPKTWCAATGEAIETVGPIRLICPAKTPLAEAIRAFFDRGPLRRGFAGCKPARQWGFCAPLADTCWPASKAAYLERRVWRW